MKVIFSAQVKPLLSYLFEHLSNQKKSPFKKEYFLIQSQAMGHYLKITLAQKFKISANYQFFFPIALMNFLQEKINFFYQCPQDNYLINENNHTVNRLTIAIFKILRKSLNSSSPIFKKFITKSEEHCFELAYELASLFDNYFFYQSSIFKINQNQLKEVDEKTQHYFHAQRKIFLELKKVYPCELPYEVSRKIINFFRSEKKKNWQSFFPSSINVFGISFLPPYYLNFLNELSDYLDINLYFFDPSYVITGSSSFPFMKKWSTQNKDFFEQLQKKDLVNLNQLNKVEIRGKDQVLLPFLKKHLYSNEEQKEIKEKLINFCRNKLKHSFLSNTPNCFFPDFMVQACTSRLNEVEVLKDVILNIIKKSNYKINLSDFLVIAPNINQYEHLIKSVFNQDPQVKYSISDLNKSQESLIFKGMEKIFSLISHGFKVNDFIEIFYIETVQKKFKLTLDDIDEIITWLKTSGIQSLGVMIEKKKSNHSFHLKNSWNRGIQKIFYSYFMTEQGFMGDINLLDDFSLKDRELLEKFLKLSRLLFKYEFHFKKKKTIQDWVDVLEKIFNDFFEFEKGFDYEQEGFKKILLEIKSYGCLTSNSAKEKNIESNLVNFSTFKMFSEFYFKNSSSKGGFLSGGVTFASFLPMRAIPFPYIFILGMDVESFPRLELKKNYDLLSVLPFLDKKGFRSKEKDDQLLLLESLFCTEKFLGISFVSNSQKSISKSNLSFLVVDMITAIAKDLNVVDYSDNDLFLAVTFFNQFEKYHPDYFYPDFPFKSFDKGYFNRINNTVIHEVTPFSRVKEWQKYLEEIKIIDSPSFRQNFNRVLKEQLTESDSHLIDLDLNPIINFFLNPLKYYFEKKLNLKLDLTSQLISPLPITLDSLTKKIIITRNWQNGHGGTYPLIEYEKESKRDFLPLGYYGQAGVAKINQDLNFSFEKSMEKMNMVLIEKGNKKISLDNFNWSHFFKNHTIYQFNAFLQHDNFKLNIVGKIDYLFNSKIRIIPVYKFKTTDLIVFWLEHLFLQVNQFSIPSMMVDLESLTIFYLSSISNLESEKILFQWLYLFFLKDKYPLPLLVNDREFSFFKELILSDSPVLLKKKFLEYFKDLFQSRSFKKFYSVNFSQEPELDLSLRYLKLFIHENYFFSPQHLLEEKEKSNYLYTINSFIFSRLAEKIEKY